MEASLYETLVRCLRRQTDAVKPVFEKYCSISDPFNVAHLSHQNFKKFVRDAGLVVAGDQAADAAFDLLFTKATNRMRAVNPRLTYQAFVATLARVIVDRNPELQPDQVTGCVGVFLASHVSRAARLEPLPSAEELLEPEVMTVLSKEAGFLRKVRWRTPRPCRPIPEIEGVYVSQSPPPCPPRRSSATTLRRAVA